MKIEVLRSFVLEGKEYWVIQPEDYPTKACKRCVLYVDRDTCTEISMIDEGCFNGLISDRPDVTEEDLNAVEIANKLLGDE